MFVVSVFNFPSPEYRPKRLHPLHPRQRGIAKNPRKNTWDAQWFYAVLTNNGLAITPKNNLITNIGFGVEGTHALQNDAKANLPTNGTDWPLIHPATIKINTPADNYNWKFVFSINSTNKKRLKSFARHYLPTVYKWLKIIKK